MRTKVEVDAELVAKAQRLSCLGTKRAVIEAALQMLVRVKQQEQILGLAGKVHWERDLDASREGRGPSRQRSTGQPACG
jgi:Arc/MetJ family transcription regulator